jgi:hypothetical protein
VVPNTGFAQVHGQRQGFDRHSGQLLQDLKQQLLGVSLAFLWRFLA